MTEELVMKRVCDCCGSDTIEHSFRPVDTSEFKVPLCSACWRKVMRRFRDHDPERMRYAAALIKSKWETYRRNGGRAKFLPEHLDEAIELKAKGLSICAVAKKIGFPQSLVHRYFTRLQEM